MAEIDTFTRYNLRFIEAYIADPRRDPEQAAVKAGLPAHVGPDMLAMPHIAEEIAFRLQRRMDKSGKAALLTKDSLEDMILQVVRRCMQKVEIIDRAGRRTGVYKFMPNSALKGIEMLADLRGYYTVPKDDEKPDGEPRLTLDEFIKLSSAARKHLSEHGELGGGHGEPVNGLRELEDNVIVVNRTTKEVAGEESTIPTDVAVSAKNIDEYFKQIKKEKIADPASE